MARPLPHLNRPGKGFWKVAAVVRVNPLAAGPYGSARVPKGGVRLMGAAGSTEGQVLCELKISPAYTDTAADLHPLS